VDDVDTTIGLRYPQAMFSDVAHAFDPLEVDDPRFHQVNAYAISRYALDMIEASVGRQVNWSFGPRLAIHPHYLEDRNAFYSRDLGALAFFYFDIGFKAGKVFTCLVHDVVAHELGHAALDGLKPGFLEQMHAETGAFHESFGDFTAMFSALSLPAVVDNVIAATGGDLRLDSIASRMAEEFGYGLFGAGHFFLRNANDPIKKSQIVSEEVHDLSVLMTATIYEILVEFYEKQKQAHPSLTDRENLLEATSHLRRMVYRGVNYLPPTMVTFRRFGRAMLAADKRAFPQDDMGYRDLVKKVFVSREIVDLGDDLDTSPSISLEWDGSTTPRDLFQFLYRNRELLKIPTDPSFRLSYPTLTEIDLSGVTAPGAAPIKECILEYKYIQEVTLMPGKTFFSVFGGTLVFDENRQLVAHFAEPEDEGGEQGLIDEGLALYQALRAKKQIKAVRIGAKPGNARGAVYLASVGPGGRARVALAGCTRFQADSLDAPPVRNFEPLPAEAEDVGMPTH
jgi:hypothetical protein